MEVKDLTTFERMVSPTLIKILYWVGLGLIALSGLGIMFSGGMMGADMHGGGLTFGSFVGGLLFMVFGGLFWRVMCEFWIVVFAIYDRLGEIRDQGR